MAHRKSGGAAKNGRDSQAQRLGVKCGDGQSVTAGSIIIRQRGTRMRPGLNVHRAADDSLFAMVTGKVKFEKGRRRVSVLASSPA